MKERPNTSSGREAMSPTVAHRRGTAVWMGTQAGDAAASVDTGEFLRKAQAHQSADLDSARSAHRPIVTKMPEGYVVVEQRVGRATAVWRLRVSCGCGYGWFEREVTEVVRCPGCRRPLRLDIDTTRP